MQNEKIYDINDIESYSAGDRINFPDGRTGIVQEKKPINERVIEVEVKYLTPEEGPDGEKIEGCTYIHKKWLKKNPRGFSLIK